ncbi:DNA-directed RNA polymerase [Friedmanniomyces endolithicus]|uniref:DNA-directed RNA polymerase n=1 Tax=Friedmanniomyces endolithicus TaxID=329885 RepID=A0AAN6FM33_9PEZI|nr:DNA-directed RNA polymerase [Friedmanniomyces endolithicus]
MLVRSASRRQHRHTSQILAASFGQLNLPWLAPAQSRWSTSRAASPVHTQHRQRRIDAPPPAHVRHLATSADQSAVSTPTPYPPPSYTTVFKNSADKNVPWDFSANEQSPQRREDRPNRHSVLRPFEEPIIINSTTRDPAQLFKVQVGIQGTFAELLQHLHTNLRVGRWTRAEAIIERLSEQSLPFAPEIRHAHTAYLEAQYKCLALQEKDSEESMKALRAMQKWIELKVRSKGIDPSAKMLVIMVRAALTVLEGNTLRRAVHRYVDWAETLGPDTLVEVLDSEEYADNEYAKLGPLTADYYGGGMLDGHELSVEEKQEMEDHIPADPQQYYRRQEHIELDELPAIMPTAQKGNSLLGVQRSIRTFVDLPLCPPDASPEEQRARAFERQHRLEKTSVDIAIERWREADEELRKIGISTAMQSKPLGALMWQWYNALLPALEEEAAEVKKLLGKTPHFRDREDDRQHFGPFMETLPLDKVAANTILYVVTNFARGKDRGSKKYETEIKLNALATGLGRQLEAEAMADMSQRKMKEFREANPGAMQPASRTNRKKLSRRAAKAQVLKDRERLDANSLLPADMTWPLVPKIKFGVMLLQKLMECAQLPVTREHPRTKEKVTQMQPAFLHHVKYVLGRKLGVVAPNPSLTDKLQSEPLGSLLAKHMPMVVEPRPWTGWNDGGYLHYPTSILRLGAGDKSGKDYFLAAASKGDLEQVYAGVTALGKVAWKVHPDVLRVQIAAWNSGEAVANFAPLHATMTAPPEPESTADGTARRAWLMELRDIENKRAGLHSKRCFQNFQLEIARAVVNETLYFPHNMDFRGRAYPIPPYLNHMGADNVRGVLVFAEGKELGDGGLRWLKIHLATAAGYDKASLEERVRFTDDNIEDIWDSVRNPLDGKRWWLKAEDAWQTLAACFELTQALASPDPTKFVSTIPIQQDGTCNGLQHYAALGGDQIGARQVNLEPGDRPSDVYTAVAEAVKDEVAKDAAAGNSVAQKLNGHLTRKCVKQPVMTNVYGVTFFGAKQQVRRQVEILFPDVGRYDPINLDHMAHYVTTKIFQSLGQMFSGAQAIQHWLEQCADRISTCLTPEQIAQLCDPATLAEKALEKVRPAARRRGAASGGKAKPPPEKRRLAYSADRQMNQDSKPLFRSTVVWTTPLRLPVVQPYRTSKAKEVKTNLQMIKLQEPQVWDPVSKRKQLQAFPPNFIHSLDATHMLLSALKCTEVGMTFAAIHDSFWTHARDVDRLGLLLRDAFVEMHSENIVGRLREEFQTRYRGCMYMATVVAKSKAGMAIAEWRKQNQASTTPKDGGELALEAKRMRLLGSEIAEEREQGMNMVTPGSIIANDGDSESFYTAADMTTYALGNLPDYVDAGDNDNSDADEFVTADDTDSAVDDAPAASHEEDEGVVGGSVLDTDTEALARLGSETDGTKDDSTDAEAGGVRSAAGQTANAKAKAKKVYPRKTFVWLPLVFPEVPAKGGFDVTRLRASQYFFH